MADFESNNLINKLKDKKIVLWGAGQNLEKKRDFVCKYIKPIMCVDSDPKLWGKEILPGIVCASPAELAAAGIDIVVITPESGYVVRSISKQLFNQYEIFMLNQIWDEVMIELQKNMKFKIGDGKMKHFSCGVGSCVCNINCSYCYVDFFDSQVKYDSQFPHSIHYMVKALSNDRLGGSAYFNICGDGETLLKPGFIELVRGLLSEGHYVGIITNGTITGKLEELLEFPKDMAERILVQFSLHYLELKRQNLLNTYFDNVNMVRNGGVSICTTIPGADEYIPYKDEIRQICLDRTGFLPVVSPIRTTARPNECFPLGSKLSWEEYLAAWSDFSSRAIEMRNGTLDRITEKCYAGKNSGWINLVTGDLRSCVPGEKIDNIYDDITREIQFFKNSHYCNEGYCSHSGMFLSGRINNSVQLPTWYEMFARRDKNGDSTFNSRIREATDYCCDY